MKLVTAMVQPEVVPLVQEELFGAQINKFSITAGVGHGTQKGYQATFRGVQTQINILKRVRIDVAVNEDFVERAIQAILKAAQTGMPGDGKIFVTDLHDCIRIRTGERGSQAIG